jgi:peptidoglycan/xylan/chitin deacetylase (PgdA/CDA1 family)
MAAVYHQALGIQDPPAEPAFLAAGDATAASPAGRACIEDPVKRLNRGLASTAPPAFRRDARQHWSQEWGKRAAAWTGAAMNLMVGGSGQTNGAGATTSFGIFNYHRIAPLVPGIPKPTINVTPLQLRQHLAGLQDRGYVIRSLSEMLRHHRLGLSVPPRTVVLTFDDGFASVYTQAWPILQEFNAPATVFLCTAYLGSNVPFPFDGWGDAYRDRAPAESWRPLRVEECREMLASGLVELGAHTHTHQDFRTHPDEFASDLRTNLDLLDSHFGLRQVPLAFPYGAYDDALLEVARREGVTCALTVDASLADVRSDPFGWGRHTAVDWDTASTLSAKREGWYGRILDRSRSIAGMARGILRRKRHQHSGQRRMA